MKFGVALGRCNPKYFLDVVDAAERLGYESVWLPEHLVLPVVMRGSPDPDPDADHPPIPATAPVFDAFSYLAFLAGRTRRIRLGTHVYNLALRHPFVAARAVQTLDLVSGGRSEVGIGAGWLAEEWEAAGLDFRTRGRRLDEAIAICKRLWTEPEIEYHGEFFDFGPVAFEPKPVQRPHPPILVGGESDAALRRAARAGDGWMGMDHDLDSARAVVLRLRSLRGDHPDDGFEVCIGARIEDAAAAERYEDLGVTRIVVAPWDRSRDAVEGLERLGDLVGLDG